MQVDARRCLEQIAQHRFGMGQMAAIDAGRWVEAALNAELGGSTPLRLTRLVLQLGSAESVRTGITRITAKGTETAVLDAVIREVDVAVNHIGHRVTHQIGAHPIGPVTQHAKACRRVDGLVRKQRLAQLQQPGGRVVIGRQVAQLIEQLLQLL